MPSGVEKVGLVNPNDKNILSTVTTGGTRKYPPLVTIQGDSEVEFEAKYYKDTPESSKGRAKWIVKPLSESPFTKEDEQGHIGDKMGVMIPAKFCGPTRYQSLEAFLNKPENKYPTRILLLGNATFKIVGTSWSKTKGGPDTRQSPVNYGDNIWLHVQTEGLNGATLEIDVFNKEMGSDSSVYTYRDVKCYYGEINLHIKNTFLWKSKTGLWTSGEEKFYIKIRLKGKKETLLDENKDDIHARYLRIKNKIIKRTIEESTSNLPLKISKTEVDLERYDPCRFSNITVTDEGKDIPLFDEGKLKLEEETKKEFAISEKIHFDLDKSFIRPDAKPVLDRLAVFLNDNPFVPVELGAHCDIRKDHAYNDRLSNERAAAGVKYLVSKGISRDRIVAQGYGKRRLLYEGENISEDLHEQNRRLTIKFKIFGGDAMSILYDTIAPDKTKKKELIFKIADYQTDKCFKKGTSYEHDTNVRVIELTPEGKEGPFEYDGKTDVKHKVFSNLSKLRLLPLDYIWPINNTTNHFWYHIHSCRYFSDKTKASVIVEVYPDIKWTLQFFLNLTNDLSVKWQNFSPAEHKKMQSKAGKIGAESRWKQKDASFGFSLDAEWNKLSKDSYQSKESFKAQYETKIKKFYDLFSSIGDMSKGITNKTKGTVRNIGFKNTPVLFAIKPPNIDLKGVWELERATKNGKLTNKIGTKVDIKFEAKPLIGLEITIDLIGAAIGLAVGAVSGGTAAPGAMKLYNTIKDKLNKGIDLGDDDLGLKANMDIYVDLVISSVISTSIGFSFNTEGDFNPEAKLELKNKLGVELRAGVLVKGEIAIIVVTVKGYFKAHASGKASVTFAHGVNYDDYGLYYQPQLGFDGVDAEYVVVASAGLSIKKGVVKDTKVEHKKEYKIAEGKYNEIVKPFDVIKSLEELIGFDSRIPLIRK